MADVAEPKQEMRRAPPPRALFVSHETTLSGAPIQLAYLVAWLKTHGWETAVVAAEEGPMLAKFRAGGAEVFVEPQLLKDPSYAALRDLAPNFDVVVANTIAAWQAVPAAHLEKVPVVWYLHETQVGVQLMNEISMLRPSLALADALVTPTQATAAVYQPFTQRIIQVVPYGIPEVERTFAPATNKPFTFVTLGTYEERKGQDVLIDAIPQLDPAAWSGALLQMAGRPLDEDFRDKIRRKAEAIGNVQVLGALDHESALQLLNGADVVVCPSRDETMPIVLLEAMSLGKAIICTEVGGVGEWIRNGLNGLLVPAEHASALAAAMARCLRDRDLVRELGVAGRRTFAENVSLDRYGAQFATLLRETIDCAKQPPPRDPYTEWAELYETLGPADRRALRRDLEQLGECPRISILLPVYNPDFAFLRAAIDSAKQQVYDHWELCIADDASTDANVRPFLEGVAAGEPRIKLTFREQNGHISACSNSALALATGEWCALLDQDDALAEHALALVALELAKHPDAGLVYSDEDKIDLMGVRSNPFFKTDWNPELFRGQNYINHLGMYRTALLREIGGFREGLEGSQDYDLALRCLERLQPEQVRHIPRILYHWRMVPGSLAEVRDAKPYAKEAARRALADHLQRLGIAGRAEPCPENIESHRVIYDLPNPAPSVAVIIAANHPAERVRERVASTRGLTRYPDYEIVVAIDPATAMESGLHSSEESGVTLLRTDGPRNPARWNNLAAATAHHEILVFLHSDTEVTNGEWLVEMVSQVHRPEVGAVGARLWYPDETLQHGGFILGLGGIAGIAHHRVPRGHAGFFNRTFLQRNCSAVTSACLAIRRTLFLELGGFDESNLTNSFQDIDLCLRVKERGLSVVWTPYANLRHHAVERESKDAVNQAGRERDADYMRKRWAAQLQEDPFYSPNLSLAEPGFHLAFPPRWFPAD